MRGSGRVAVRLKTVAMGVFVAGLLLQASTAFAKSADEPEAAMSPEGNFLAAVIAGQARDAVAEARFMREALAADPSDALLQQRALIAFLGNGDMADAFRVAERIVRQGGSEEVLALAYTSLGVRAMHDKRFSDARRLFDRAASPENQKRDPTSAILKGWTHVAQGDRRRAYAALDPYRRGELRSLADYFTGLMASVARDDKTADQHLRAAYEANRRDIRAGDAFARFLAGRGDVKAATAIYDGLDLVFPNAPMFADARAATRAGKAPAPLVRSSLEGAAELFFALSDIGDPTAAGRAREQMFLQFARFLAPDSPVFTLSLAQAYEANGQSARAVEIYATIAGGSAFRKPSDIRRIRALQRLERSDEAIALTESLLKTTPTDAELLQTLAQLQRVRKDYPASIAAYDRAIAAAEPIEPAEWDLLYERGFVHDRNKDWPKAEADFKRALDVLPKARAGEPYAQERAQILNYLAYTWVDRHENIDLSFDMLRDAVELTNAREGYIVDSLGWAFYRLGRYDDAVRELEKAIELKPGDPVINDHLGDAYWRVGREREARFKWNHARDLKPEPADLERIEKKIKAGALVEPPKSSKVDDKSNGG
jgi:tetratricopeptide (TPR) repeat protein